MIDKAAEVDAHAIGMSGLLVKSTLIMRDNLEELNTRELSDIPVLLGGAALTRSYVERDLRGVYRGRLFYGKDAFEGLRVMDRLGEIRTDPGADDPDWGVVPSESRFPAACVPRPTRRRGRRTARSLPRRRGRQPTRGGPLHREPDRQGPVARRDRRLHQRDSAVPQPVGLPTDRRRGRRRLQGPHPPRVPRAVGQDPRRRSPRPSGGLRLLAGQRRRQRSGGVGGRVPRPRADPLLLSPQHPRALPLHRRLLPAHRIARRPTPWPS